MYRGHFRFTVQAGLLNNECVLRIGIYEFILRVVGKMERAYTVVWRDNDKELVQFRYAAVTRRVTITFMDDH